MLEKNGHVHFNGLTTRTHSRCLLLKIPVRDQFPLLRASNKLLIDRTLQLYTTSRSVCRHAERRLSCRPQDRKSPSVYVIYKKSLTKLGIPVPSCSAVARRNTKIHVLTRSLFLFLLLLKLLCACTCRP